MYIWCILCARNMLAWGRILSWKPHNCKFFWVKIGRAPMYLMESLTPNTYINKYLWGGDFFIISLNMEKCGYFILRYKFFAASRNYSGKLEKSYLTILRYNAYHKAILNFNNFFPCNKNYKMLCEAQDFVFYPAVNKKLFIIFLDGFKIFLPSNICSLLFLASMLHNWLHLICMISALVHWPQNFYICT